MARGGWRGREFCRRRLEFDAQILAEESWRGREFCRGENFLRGVGFGARLGLAGTEAKSSSKLP
ncbi:hypothetical protein [Campylobacter sp.]|uniref:hypothetical protein n=1 Tax=Campylobacter sp. TaxID=205 RepID=UPI0026DDAB8A|nr:hypothetical protein [Campylobacter sp.]MDO4674924.1 hypothetical protein [Campylobacter sp.]